MGQRWIQNWFEGGHAAALADWLVVALALSLPWSTSATSILLVFWLVAVIPTLTWRDVSREIATFAGGLPVALLLLAVAGMLWSDASLIQRWSGLVPFSRLLTIPLFMAQFRRSDRGFRVFAGFLIACTGVLVASVAITIWQNLPKATLEVGVPVKDHITQSLEFTICAAVLLYMTAQNASAGRWLRAGGLAVWSLAFLGDIFFISAARTALVIMPALALLYGFRTCGWKGIFFGGAGVVLFAAMIGASSPYIRGRVSAIYAETSASENHGAETSSGERIVFWEKSLKFIAEAPLIGHGTGSITHMFREAAIGKTGVFGMVSTNPHNQTFTVGIQLGLFGVLILWAMWISQFVVFRGADLLAWIGLVIVTQNIVGSLFNSFLFDFTSGWLYIIGFGVAAGMRHRHVHLAEWRHIVSPDLRWLSLNLKK